MVAQGRVPYHEHDDSDVREALAVALGERAKQNRRTQRNNRIAQLLAYLLLFVVFGYVFQTQANTTDRLCEGATENRVALRQLVNGVGDLGRGLVLGPRHQDDDYVSPEQQIALAQIEAFRTGQLETLELPICER